MTERRSCTRCLHADVCAVARPVLPMIALVVSSYFGKTPEEVARKCLQYLDVAMLQPHRALLAGEPP